MSKQISIVLKEPINSFRDLTYTMIHNEYSSHAVNFLQYCPDTGAAYGTAWLDIQLESGEVHYKIEDIVGFSIIEIEPQKYSDPAVDEENEIRFKKKKK